MRQKSRSNWQSEGRPPGTKQGGRNCQFGRDGVVECHHLHPDYWSSCWRALSTPDARNRFWESAISRAYAETRRHQECNSQRSQSSWRGKWSLGGEAVEEIPVHKGKLALVNHRNVPRKIIDRASNSTVGKGALSNFVRWRCRHEGKLLWRHPVVV